MRNTISVAVVAVGGRWQAAHRRSTRRRSVLVPPSDASRLASPRRTVLLHSLTAAKRESPLARPRWIGGDLEGFSDYITASARKSVSTTWVHGDLEGFSKYYSISKNLRKHDHIRCVVTWEGSPILQMMGGA